MFDPQHNSEVTPEETEAHRGRATCLMERWCGQDLKEDETGVCAEVILQEI